MSQVELKEIDEIKPSTFVDLKSVLQIYAKILKSGVIDRPIVIDGETGVVLEGHELLQALDLLSAQRWIFRKLR